MFTAHGEVVTEPVNRIGGDPLGGFDLLVEAGRRCLLLSQPTTAEALSTRQPSHIAGLRWRSAAGDLAQSQSESSRQLELPRFRRRCRRLRRRAAAASSTAAARMGTQGLTSRIRRLAKTSLVAVSVRSG